MLGARKYRGCWVHVKRRDYGLRSKKIRRRSADFFVFAKAKDIGFWYWRQFRDVSANVSSKSRCLFRLAVFGYIVSVWSTSYLPTLAEIYRNEKHEWHENTQFCKGLRTCQRERSASFI